MRTFYVVRHAKAGSRSHWTGDDRKRPLSSKGIQQADELVSVLAPLPVGGIYTSGYLRCVQTVEPLARARKLEIQRSPSLEEGQGLEGLTEFLGDRSLDAIVLCTHADIIAELVDDLMVREVIAQDAAAYAKGSIWVLGVDDHGVAERARYIPPP